MTDGYRRLRAIGNMAVSSRTECCRSGQPLADQSLAVLDAACRLQCRG